MRGRERNGRRRDRYTLYLLRLLLLLLLLVRHRLLLLLLVVVDCCCFFSSRLKRVCLLWLPSMLSTHKSFVRSCPGFSLDKFLLVCRGNKKTHCQIFIHVVPLWTISPLPHSLSKILYPRWFPKEIKNNPTINNSASALGTPRPKNWSVIITTFVPSS
jgi:hypothetical protein